MTAPRAQDDISLIVLNGTSSSGKTTLARALLDRLPEPWLNIQGDQFLAMSPNRDRFSREEWMRFWRGVYRAIAALGSEGNRAVVDIVVMQALGLPLLAKALDGVNALFVGVRCSLDVAEERERVRLNPNDPVERRTEGIARRQFDLVHAHDAYDVEVDTSRMSPEECTEAVLARMAEGPPVAFAKLRSSP